MGRKSGWVKRSRRLFWLAGLCLMVGVGIWVVAGRSKEPRYQGKTAEQWFQAFEKAKTNYNSFQTMLSVLSANPVRVVQTSTPQLPPAPRNALTNYYRVQSSPRTFQSQVLVYTPVVGTSNFVRTVTDDYSLAHDRTVDGLRALGTNAALYLAQEIRRGESPWTSWYRTKFGKFPSAVKALAPTPPAPRALIQNDAAFVLGCLGIAAEAASHILIEGLKDPNPASRLNCVGALRKLNFPLAEVDVVLQEFARNGNRRAALEIASSLGLHTPTVARLLGEDLGDTDPATRRKAAESLRYFGPTARIVAPKLGAALSDSNQDVRYAAAYALEALGPDAAVAVPELTAALGSEDSEMRYLSARALSCIGIEAVEAVPALIWATNDQSEMVRRAAGRALENMGPKGQ